MPWDGCCRVAGVEVFSQRVDAVFRVRAVEVDRRRALGVGAIDNWEVLQALMTLPEGVAVPITALETDALLMLDELVRWGMVDEVDGGVIRRAVTPVELVALVKTTTTWSEVTAITLLRTHAPRLVIVPPRLARRVLREIDPEVGVAMKASDGTIECRRVPGRRHVRPTWRRWATAETVYQAWLDTGHRLSGDHGDGAASGQGHVGGRP